MMCLCLGMSLFLGLGAATAAAQAALPGVHAERGEFYVDASVGGALVDTVNHVFAACGSAPCAVHLPPGEFHVAGGTIHMTRPMESLLGAGRSLTRIVYSGAGPFVDLHQSAAAYSVAGFDTIRGFALQCSDAAATGLYVGSGENLTLQDLNVVGPGGLLSRAPAGSSEGIVWQNTVHWAERWTMRDIQLGGWGVGIRFKAPTGAGTPSFGYGRAEGLQFNSERVQVQVDGGAEVYHLAGWSQIFNASSPGPADAVFVVGGTFSGRDFAVTGESGGKPLRFLHVLKGGVMRWSGSYDVWNIHPDLPVVDAGGRFEIGPAAGELGVLGLTAAVGEIKDFAGSGSTVRVFPRESLGGDNPAYTAQRAYVVGGQVKGAGIESAPLEVFDPSLRYCAATLVPRYNGHPVNEATPVWCVDGSGDTVQPARNPAGVVSHTAARTFDEHTYVTGPVIGNRMLTNASETLEVAPAAKRAVGELTCQSITGLVVGEPYKDAVRVCSGPDNATNFDVRARLYLQVAAQDGGPRSWRTVFEGRPDGATVGVPLEARSLASPLRTPPSSAAACAPGEFADDANFHYVCVARNRWKRVALSSF